LTEWRLIQDDIHEARHHFAMEEALARLVDEGKTPPTLRLRRVHPAVFVGVYQDTWSEVDVDYCRANRITIVRRANGGGAVYHEMGSFCFSAFFHRDLFPQSEEELYRLFAGPAIRTCADYGVTASFQGRNDLLVEGRKIYGSAQFSWYGAFVQSGTFLVNMDFDAMQRSLTPPALKFAGKPAGSIKERVTSLSREVGREVDTLEVMDRFAVNAADVLGVTLTPGGFTREELDLAAELLAVKYGTDEWNLGTRPAFQVMVADRMETGVISLSADMEGRVIKKARINGDLLLTDRPAWEDLQGSLAGCSLEEARIKMKASALPGEIRESLFRLLEKLDQEVNARIPAHAREKAHE
jgi:lipoate-protein ligase A